MVKIVEVNNAGRIYYEIHKHGLFGWRPIEVRTVCCDDGLGSDYDTLIFNSIKDAENYINNGMSDTTRKDVKIIPS